MSTKAHVQTQAKTPAASVPANQPPVAVPEREAERPDIATQLEGAARLGHSLQGISVDGATPPLVQRQELPEEEEELQMQRESAALQRQELPEEEEVQMQPETAAVQRQVLPEEEEEELQMMRQPAALQRQELPEEEEEELQMKPDRPQVGLEGGPVPPEVQSAIRRARGGGQPLDGAIQAEMGETLGHDFSGVRVHTDAQADALNRQLGARAFTTGRDIFFRQGEYSPGAGSGREVLAHELSHVVQQGQGRLSGVGRGMAVRPAGDAFEDEADVTAREATSAGFEARAQAAGRIQRHQTESKIDTDSRTLIQRLIVGVEQTTLEQEFLNDNGWIAASTAAVALKRSGQDQDVREHTELGGYTLNDKSENIYFVGHGAEKKWGDLDPREVAQETGAILPPEYKGELVSLSCSSGASDGFQSAVKEFADTLGASRVKVKGAPGPTLHHPAVSGNARTIDLRKDPGARKVGAYIRTLVGNVNVAWKELTGIMAEINRGESNYSKKVKRLANASVVPSKELYMATEKWAENNDCLLPQGQEYIEETSP